MTVLHADPVGGQVVAGTGSITQTGSTTNITQTSPNLSLNWTTFNIAPSETVNFLQPSASAIAVNRIFDTNGTQILGQLNANGQVYLLNPNGVLFAPGAQVNVAGLVASTLDLNDASLQTNQRIFSGAGTGSIVNQGTITAAPGGSVALLGQHVRNEGVITAQLGTVALGAGSAATLTFAGNNLVQLQVGESVLNNLAANGGLIRADGGMVFMTAGAKDALLASVVNNTGVIEARTVENRQGTILLLGSMTAGTAQVGGTLDASAPDGGNGGFIETSAAQVQVAELTRVTTHSAAGQSGLWLIDPADFTIAAAGGNISGTTLSTSLTGSSVLIQSSSGTPGGNGDINVNDAVSWSANSLTLTAARDININAVMSASGSSLLFMNTATGNGADLGVVGGAVKVGLISGAFTGRVDFPGRAGPGILTINGLAYTIVNALGLSTTTTVTDLQGMNSGLATNYALGTDIDAAPTSAWNAGAGFVPIGTPGTPFAGRFDGLGHVITGLSVTSGAASAGLFGATGPGLSFQNVGLVGGNVLGAAGTGGLIGTNGTGSTISNSYNTGTVTGSAGTGGLVGDNTTGAITYSFTTGSVSGSAGTGGLAGTNTTGAISYSYSTSAVAGSGAGTGGLVGSNTTGAISQSYATGDVTGTGAATGGLAGSSGASLINDTYATGNVIGGGSGVGGLLGSNDGVVNTSYSAGSVSGSGSNMGSLVGQIGAGSVINSFWDTTNSVVQAGFGIGMDTSQMMSQANFTSPTPPNGNVNPNWDFANTWTMAEGVTYPLLRPFMTSLTVTANNDSKIYDGQAYSGGNGVTYSTTPNGTLLGTLSYSGTSQGAINVNNYAITPGGLYSSQQGYVITFVNGSLAINPFAVSLTGSRTYDGTVNMPAAALVIGSLTNGETLTLSGTGSVTSRNVGTLKPLTLGTLALGNGTGLASNYTFIGGTQTANITQALMTVTAQTDTKTYNGTNASAVTPLITSGALQTGDTTTTFAQNFDNANAGIGKTLVPTGGVNDGNAGANYAYTFVTTTTGVIDRKPVTLSGTTAISRPYNGNTLATLSNAGSVTTGVGAETLVVNSPLAANINFNSKDVLTANQVTGTGFTLGNGTNGGLASNYVLTSTTAAVAASITPAALTAIVAAPSKIYNGNTTAAPTLTITAGLVNTETVTATGTATFNTKDVLTANLVTVNSATLANGTNGGLASNYSLASGQTVAASITRAALIATVAAPSKVYNGNTTATPTLTITSGLVNTETVTATGTATFNTKDVLTANQVTVNSTTLANGTNGGLASNYSLGTGQTVAASITPAALTATLGASTKVYNGTTTATPILTITAGLVNAEIVTATGAGTYNTKDVLTANQVTVNSVTLANGANGGLASNYSLGAGQTAAATITPLAVSLTGTRVYNRATDFAAATLTMSSLVGSETLTLTGTGSVVDRNVGTGKSLTLGTLALGNQTGLASNYALSGGTHSASITRAPLVLSTLPVVKPYDGNVSALGTAVVTGGTLFTGDTISGGTFAYTDPNVGYGNKTVTVAAVALNDGNSGGNYQISYANSTTSTISVHPVFGPAAAVQTLSLQESLRRNALSLTPTITVSGTYIPTLIVDDFALETGNGRAVNSTMGMGRTGPALHLEETRSAPRDSENNRGGDNSTGTKSL